MAVVIETTAGDLTVDLFVQERPRACLNFLKLCRLKYYNFNLFHTIEHGFIAQTGDPTGAGDGGESVWGVLDGREKRFFAGEYQPKIRHSEPGLLSMVSLGDGLIGSQFFFTLGDDLTSLDGTHCVIGQVTEGQDVLRVLNETICDTGHRPYQDVRITHTVVLEDPFENPGGFREPSRSPSPSAERLKGGRIGADEDIDDTQGKTAEEVAEMLQEREAKARATILEIVGDLPDAEMAPPENVLFVCKLNPVTSDEDLEIIFSRFGRVVGCEVIRDRVSGDSLQYAFVEFEDSKTCESAYFKMDNVLIDDRRIHVDFSQSVAKVQWKGKGKGLVYKDGQKGDRLNFGDLKKSGKGGEHGKESGGGGRGERQFKGPDRRQPYRPVNRDRSRSPLKRDRQTERNHQSPVRNNRPDDRRQRSPRRDLDRQARIRQDYDRQTEDRSHRSNRDGKDDRNRGHNNNSDVDRSRRQDNNRNGVHRDRPTSRDRTSRTARRSPSPNNHRKPLRSPERSSRKDRSPERKFHKDRSPERKSHKTRSPEVKTIHRKVSSSSGESDDSDRSARKKAKKSKKKSSKDKKKKSKSKKSKKTKKSSKRSSSSDSDSSSSTSD